MIYENEIKDKDFSIALDRTIGKLEMVSEVIYQGDETETQKLAQTAVLEDSINDLKTIYREIYEGR